MRLIFEDREWVLDTDHIRLSQARVIQEQTGLSVHEWTKSLLMRRASDTGEIPLDWLNSMAALYWLMRQQSGAPVEYDDVDFDVFGFANVYLDGVRKELDEAKARAQAKQEAVPEPAPFPQVAPASPEPPIPTGTTQLPPAYRQHPTAYMPPVT